MVEWSVVQALMKCFPRSFINSQGEIIFHEFSNTYFNLSTCENKLDVDCKVLEWLSRAAHKSSPYKSKRGNDEFHQFILGGINSYLHTSFTEQDMDLIYTKLGNACNHYLTILFVLCNYNLDVLRQKEVQNDEPRKD